MNVFITLQYFFHNLRTVVHESMLKKNNPDQKTDRVSISFTQLPWSWLASAAPITSALSRRRNSLLYVSRVKVIMQILKLMKKSSAETAFSPLSVIPVRPRRGARGRTQGTSPPSSAPAPGALPSPSPSPTGGRCKLISQQGHVARAYPSHAEPLENVAAI